MRIAIIGSGISGLVCAHLLHPDHDITLFEANDYVGGHTNTIDVEAGGRAWPVDTGFIVFNDWTYPNFIKLLDRLGVASQPSEMSFSVSCERTGLEYNGGTLNRLFAQRSNLLRPGFHRMLADILRFNRACRGVADGDARTLREFTAAGRYSRRFIEHYLVPMGSAIWSADASRFLDTPLAFFAGFMRNHGMLNWSDRPQWRVVSGGSREYVRALTAPFPDRIRLRTPIERVRRFPDRVEVQPCGAAGEHFDQVIIATHSDQALAMLADASPAEREILATIPYQANDTVLHTDSFILPRRKRAWASWNYRIPRKSFTGVTMTYHANTLQGFRDAPREFCVSLNLSESVNPAEIVRRIGYQHPVFTPAGVASQARKQTISGVNRTYYCGAYWGYGFHEDGVNSALDVCRDFG